MSNPLETALYDYMTANGIDRSTAKTAAENCSRAMIRSGLAGITASFAITLLTGGWGTLGAGLAGVALSSATLLGAPSCQNVREAANNWARSRG